MTASAAPAPRAHRVLVPTLIVVATLVGCLAAFAVWVNRQALNTDNWTATSSKVLANQQVNAALSAYLVDQVFSNADVAGALQSRLPPQAQGLAGPAAAGLRQVADRTVPEILATPRAQALWQSANRAAHKQLLKIIDGGGPALSTQGGEVTLDLRVLITQIAAALGLQNQVAAARSKLQGSSGAAAKSTVQQKLGITLPAGAGKLTIMRAGNLETAQNIAKAVKGLAIVLPALALILFALAVWFAGGWRRVALRRTGWSLVVIGVLLLLIRRVAGNAVTDALVKVPSNRPAVHEVWNIGTSLLYAIAVAMIAYGIVTVLAAWLAGPTRAARFLRQSLAPVLRDSPAIAYGAVGALLLVLVLWGPTPAFRQVAWILLFAALLGLGVTMLRRETAVEFPFTQPGDAVRDLRARRETARARNISAAAAAASAGAGAEGAPAQRTPDGARLDDMERLAGLHDRGALTDEEFAAEKTHIMADA